MSLSRKPTKVVIPVAGLGSRFLPATKAIPKELLPIIDRPIIHYIVQEAVNAGLETVVFVTSRPKVSIEDYFDPADLTSFKLAQSGKDQVLEEVFALTRKIDIVSVRQYEALGLGHAVLTAKPVVNGQSFAVVLGDDIIKSSTKDSAIGQCINLFNSHSEGNIVGTLTVSDEEKSKYGIAELMDNSASLQVKKFIEKPKPSETTSCLALPGRYVFSAGIIEALMQTPKGRNDEIQLTDAMQILLKKEPFYAKSILGERYDTGDKLGYIMANVAFALDKPEYKEFFSAWLKSKL